MGSHVMRLQLLNNPLMYMTAIVCSALAHLAPLVFVKIYIYKMSVTLTIDREIMY